MRNESCFRFRVTDEQVQYANQLVEYSIEHHPVSDVFSQDPADSNGLYGVDRKRVYRFRGTLGEVLFADIYDQPRPKRSYGAIDGQDFGKDFSIPFNGQDLVVDLKTMHRNVWRSSAHFVLDLPAYQLDKPESQTQCYFHISLIYQESDLHSIDAVFVGYIPKREVKQYGELFPAGTNRVKDNGGKVPFHRDTYEIMFGDFISPPWPLDCQAIPKFQKIEMSQTEAYSKRRQRLDSQSQTNR